MSMSSAHARYAEHARNTRDHSGEPLNSARGIMIGCIISAGLWVGLIAFAMS